MLPPPPQNKKGGGGGDGKRISHAEAFRGTGTISVEVVLTRNTSAMLKGEGELIVCDPLKVGGTKGFTLSRDATPQSGKIRKFEKCQNVANKCIKWSTVVLTSVCALI